MSSSSPTPSAAEIEVLHSNVDAALASTGSASIVRARVSKATCALLAVAPLRTHARIGVWSSLLCIPEGIDDDAHLAAAIANVALTAPNQRVITADAARTRADDVNFAGAASRIERLLTYYVSAGGGHGGVNAVTYRQGLNEVLAGVLLAGFASVVTPPLSGDLLSSSSNHLPLSDARASALLAGIVSRFIPRVYAGAGDADMTALQCSLVLFRLQLLYHDPALARHLSGFNVPPELYAVPWFLTLFARGAVPSVVLALWDILIAAADSPGPALLHSIAVAFAANHRESLLASSSQGTAAAELPAQAARLAFRDVAHARAVAAAGLDVHRRTPLSFRRLTAAV